MSCPATLTLAGTEPERRFDLTITECSISGFRARCEHALPLDGTGETAIDLGQEEHSRLPVTVARKALSEEDIFVFRVHESDLPWRKFVAALSKAATHGELGEASRFIE